MATTWAKPLSRTKLETFVGVGHSKEPGDNAVRQNLLPNQDPEKDGEQLVARIIEGMRTRMLPDADDE